MHFALSCSAVSVMMRLSVHYFNLKAGEVACLSHLLVLLTRTNSMCTYQVKKMVFALQLSWAACCQQLRKLQRQHEYAFNALGHIKYSPSMQNCLFVAALLTLHQNVPHQQQQTQCRK
jgi:hypothetical protein